MDNNKEYILCAAIKRVKPRFEKDIMYFNNDINNIEIGYRHHDILRRFEGEVERHPKAQGFYTSKGRFVNRVEAMEIALNAGQVSEDLAYKEKELEVYNPLYSEDLY